MSDAGRIEVYIHSDSITPHKVGCLVDVRCQTSFAAKSPEFLAFCKEVAKMGCAYQANSWESLVRAMDHRDEKGTLISVGSIENTRLALEKELKENVWVARMQCFMLTDEIPSYQDTKDAELKSRGLTLV